MRKLLRAVIALALIAMMLAPSVGAVAASTSRPPLVNPTRPYIHPALLDPHSSVWRYGALVDKSSVLTLGEEQLIKALEAHGVKVVKAASVPVARVMVVLPAGADTSLVKAVVSAMPRVIAVLPTHMYTVVLGLATWRPSRN
jgi:hypothetical protein